MNDSLVHVSIEMTRTVLPMIIVLGVVGNSFSIAVLTRPLLGSQACSYYFLALSVNNLFYSSFILIISLLSDGYQLDAANSSIIVCRILQYILTMFPALSPFFIVLASIDRFCASSMNAVRRKFSSISVARKAIIIVIVCFAVFYISTLVVIDRQDAERQNCRIRAGTIYNQLYVFIQVFLLTVVAPVLMIIFGFMTIVNIRRLRLPSTTIFSSRRTDFELVRMLLVQVIIHLILNLPLAMANVILLLPRFYMPTQLFFSIYTILRLPSHFSYATPFILYIVSARVYRIEFIRLFLKMCRQCCSIRVVATVDTRLSPSLSIHSRVVTPLLIESGNLS